MFNKTSHIAPPIGRLARILNWLWCKIFVILSKVKDLKNIKVQLIAPYKTYPLPLREGIKGRGVL